MFCPSTPFEVWHCLNSNWTIYSNSDYLFICCFLFIYMYVGYVEYPFEIRCSNCSASLSSSLLETRKMTANIFGHFSFSISFRLLAFGFIVLLRCCRPNETKQKEKRNKPRDEKRNEKKWNSNWNWNSNLNLNSSEAFVINSKIHTPCRAERIVQWGLGDKRGMRGEAVCCCCCLFLSCSLSLPRWLAMLFCLNINDDENTRNYSVYALGQPVFMLIFSVFFPFPFFGC